MNFIELMEVLKGQIDHETFTRLHNDFFDDYAEVYKSLKPCKSAMEKAVKKYVAGARFKGENNMGLYSTGTTALFMPGDIPEAENTDIKSTNIGKLIMDMIKTRRPTECYFMESIALYKTLKRQNKGTYFLCIDGYYYDASLVSEMVDCVADKKESYISAEICENGALLIHQKCGALVLPVKTPGVPVNRNVNFRDFLNYVNDIDKTLIDKAAKVA